MERLKKYEELMSRNGIEFDKICEEHKSSEPATPMPNDTSPSQTASRQDPPRINSQRQKDPLVKLRPNTADSPLEIRSGMLITMMYGQGGT
jgi:hypothetical protein